MPKLDNFLMKCCFGLSCEPLEPVADVFSFEKLSIFLFSMLSPGFELLLI